MILTTVGTGSNGNCYLIKAAGVTIALDCGVRWKDVLLKNNFDIGINFSLVTHVHGDHARHIKEFEKNFIPVYSNEEVAEKYTGVTILSERKKYIISGCAVIPFMVPHDALNYAYIIIFPNGEKLLYATDYEMIKYRFTNMEIEHFLVACNYSEEISEDSVTFKHVLYGHSSMEVVRDFILANKTDKLKSVSLCHLSDKNANKAKIERCIGEILEDNIAFNILENGTVIKT